MDCTNIQTQLYRILSPFSLFGDVWVGVGENDTGVDVTAYVGPNLLIARHVAGRKSPDQVVAHVVDLDGARLVRQIDDWVHGNRLRFAVPLAVGQVS